MFYLRSLLSVFRLLADKGHKVGEGVVSIFRVLCGTVLGGLVLCGRLLLVVAAGGAGAAEAGGGYRRPVLRGQACGSHDRHINKNSLLKKVRRLRQGGEV